MLLMRLLRARSSVTASIALLWQLLAVIFVPAALCCSQGSASAAAGHAGMTDCPMQDAAAQAACPVHGQTGATHDCDCPRLGCAQTDNGFMALYGPIGVLPAPALVPSPHLAGTVASVISPSTLSLAPVPVAPPPRA